MKQTAAYCLAATVGLCSIAVTTFLMARPGPEPATTETAEVVEGLRAIRTELQDIAVLLKNRHETLPAAPFVSPTREAESEDLGEQMRELTAAVVGLQARLEVDRQEARDLLQRAGELQAPSLDAIRQHKPEPDWDALDNLQRHFAADHDAAERSLRLLSRREVLGRFGPPTMLSAYNAALHWVYRRRDVDGQRLYDVTFVFQEDLVIQVWVKLRSN